jgi:hypothetical protein
VVNMGNDTEVADLLHETSCKYTGAGAK